MASVTFPAGVGGDGSTVSDDANPTTGLANGGHRTRFVPALSQVVAVAQNTVTQATNAASSAAASAASATTALNAPATQATSTTSLAIGTGSRSLTLVQTGKAFQVGQYVTIVSTASTTNWMIGAITAFTSGTGAMTVNVTTANGSGTLASWAVSPVAPPLPSSSSVSEFSVSGTWTKPAGATFVTVECWGAGGGGGSGARFASGNPRPGGGGGGGGSYVSRIFNANELPSSVQVIVGAGGVGGAAVTVDGAVGVTGGSGGNTSFGATVIAYGGARGEGAGAGGSTGGGGGGTQGPTNSFTGGAPQQSPTQGGTIRNQAFGGGDGAQGSLPVNAHASGFGGGGGGGATVGGVLAPGSSSWGGVGGHAGGTINSGTTSFANSFFNRTGYFGFAAIGGMAYPTTATVQCQGMAFGNGTFAQTNTTMGNGGIVTSANGTTWTMAPGVGGPALARLWYHGTQWIASESNGEFLFTSTDLVTWRCVAASATAFRAIAFANGLYVAVGDTGSILVSTNLIIWSARTSGTSQNLNDVIHDGTRFIAVGQNGVSLTSTDGSTWTLVTTASSGNWTRVASSGSVIVAQSNATPFAWRSTNAGATWSPVATTLLNPNGYDGVLFANSLFVMAANTGIFTSTDGNNWTSRTNPTGTTVLVGVAYSGTTWAIGLWSSTANAAITSTDGTTWTTRTVTSITTGAQAGQAGAAANGGGGGAGSTNGSNSGAGGAGGSGYCRVTVV